MKCVMNYAIGKPPGAEQDSPIGFVCEMPIGAEVIGVGFDANQAFLSALVTPNAPRVFYPVIIATFGETIAPLLGRTIGPFIGTFTINTKKGPQVMCVFRDLPWPTAVERPN